MTDLQKSLVLSSVPRVVSMVIDWIRGNISRIPAILGKFNARKLASDTLQALDNYISIKKQFADFNKWYFETSLPSNANKKINAIILPLKARFLATDTKLNEIESDASNALAAIQTEENKSSNIGYLAVILEATPAILKWLSILYSVWQIPELIAWFKGRNSDEQTIRALDNYRKNIASGKSETAARLQLETELKGVKENIIDPQAADNQRNSLLYQAGKAAGQAGGNIMLPIVAGLGIFAAIKIFGKK